MKLYKKDLISSPDVVYDYLKASLKGVADEEFKVMFLNSRNRLLAVETIQKGTVNKSVVYPRKIVDGHYTIRRQALLFHTIIRENP